MPDIKAEHFQDYCAHATPEQIKTALVFYNATFSAEKVRDIFRHWSIKKDSSIYKHGVYLTNINHELDCTTVMVINDNAEYTFNEGNDNWQYIPKTWGDFISDCLRYHDIELILSSDWADTLGYPVIPSVDTEGTLTTEAGEWVPVNEAEPVEQVFDNSEYPVYRATESNDNHLRGDLFFATVHPDPAQRSKFGIQYCKDGVFGPVFWNKKYIAESGFWDLVEKIDDEWVALNRPYFEEKYDVLTDLSPMKYKIYRLTVDDDIFKRGDIFIATPISGPAVKSKPIVAYCKDGIAPKGSILHYYDISFVQAYPDWFEEVVKNVAGVYEPINKKPKLLQIIYVIDGSTHVEYSGYNDDRDIIIENGSILRLPNHAEGWFKCTGSEGVLSYDKTKYTLTISFDKYGMKKGTYDLGVTLELVNGYLYIRSGSKISYLPGNEDYAPGYFLNGEYSECRVPIEYIINNPSEYKVIDNMADYFLLMDTPDVSKGTEFIWLDTDIPGYYANGDIEDAFYDKETVENNPSWFRIKSDFKKHEKPIPATNINHVIIPMRQFWETRSDEIEVALEEATDEDETNFEAWSNELSIIMSILNFIP